MNNQAIKRLLLLSVPFVMGLSGCAAFDGMYIKPDQQRVTEDGHKQIISDSEKIQSAMLKAFPDVPIPASHRIDLSESVIFTSPTQTIGKIVLKGSASIDSLFRFFETNMKDKGWSEVNAFQSAVSSLYFAKPGRFVAIVITQDATVYINVGPE